jgi:hypothetical protein
MKKEKPLYGDPNRGGDSCEAAVAVPTGKVYAGSDRDAGSDESRAIEIKPGTYLHNYLSDIDTIDVFKFKASGARAINSRPDLHERMEASTSMRSMTTGALLAMPVHQTGERWQPSTV